MPLPEQPSCVTCNFDPITDNHFPMRNTIDVDVYTDRNNATDNVANQVYSYIHNSDDDDDVMTDNATDADGTESSRKRVRDRWGDKAAGNCRGEQSGARDAAAAPGDRMGNENRWGNRNHWGAEPAVPKPSAGVFQPSKHPRFS